MLHDGGNGVGAAGHEGRESEFEVAIVWIGAVKMVADEGREFWPEVGVNARANGVSVFVISENERNGVGVGLGEKYPKWRVCADGRMFVIQPCGDGAALKDRFGRERRFAKDEVRGGSGNGEHREQDD